MIDVTTEILAYAMEAAYKNNKSMPLAVRAVKDQYQNADTIILTAMWAAIDAHVDINDQ